ncbi:MAG: hypothetical protein Q8934_14335 [Bacillota bacterium]|nr:hypothetical protein [Bacillota bacterium]
MVKKGKDEIKQISKDKEITPIDISAETKDAMALFFMNTSIPRILAEMAKNEESSKEINQKN